MGKLADALGPLGFVCVGNSLGGRDARLVSEVEHYLWNRERNTGLIVTVIYSEGHVRVAGIVAKPISATSHPEMYVNRMLTAGLSVKSLLAQVRALVQHHSGGWKPLATRNEFAEALKAAMPVVGERKLAEMIAESYRALAPPPS